MRITNQMRAGAFLRDLNAILERQERTQARLTSGKTIQRPSDDPVGAGRALGLHEALAQHAQYQRNIDSARAFLNTTAASMQSMVDLLQRAHELAVQGASDTLDNGQRTAVGMESEQLLRQMVAIGNTRFQSYYLFGGTDQSAPPYALAEGAALSVTPPTNPGQMEREIGIGERLTINVPGDTVLPPAFDALSALRNAAVNGTSNDVRSAISQLDSALTTMSEGLAEVGAKLNRLDSTQQRSEAAQLNLQEVLSRVEDTDLAEVLTDLSLQQTAYQAALATGAKILPPSLIDFLR